MNQEIEIEFKNILTREEFQALLIEYALTPEHFTLQQNYYFDTEEFDLKKHGAALRIRHKNGGYVLTLKQPIEEGILETHQVLVDKLVSEMLTGGILVPGDVKTIIEGLQIDSSKITYLGTLETSRAEIPYLGGILVFDKSHYLNQEDFELEYEVKDYKKGQENFSTLLREHGIPSRITENKIQRFFNAKKILSSSKE